MQYQQILPPPSLQHIVESFWVLESSTKANNKIFEPVTDGCPGLIFHNKSMFYAPEEKMPSLFVYGQTLQRRTIYLGESISLLGVCLHPSALKYLFGYDAFELSDDCFDIKTLIQNYNSDLLLQLQESNATEERIDHLCRFFIDQLAHVRTKPDQDLAYALQTIVQQAGRVSLKALQQELRISERTFERKFKSYVGVSPKLFTRICRFQSSLKQLRAGKYQKLSDIAFDNGYSDQSHFIRDFKRFSGHLPLQYQQANPLVENFSI